MRRFAAFSVTLALAMAFAAPPAAARDLLVFAAASLKEPLDTLVAARGAAVVSYGGSGTLARQVTLGAPVDVIVLANQDWMQLLLDGGHVVPDTVATVAGNRLVLAGRPGPQVPLTAEGLSAALGDGRLAIGRTVSVPAGIYGRAALQSLGLWDGLHARLAEVDNVRAALALVERGEAPLGLVYVTDLRVAPGLVVRAAIPPESHPEIRYLAAAVTDTAAARTFVNALTGQASQDLLRQAGFAPPAEDAD